MKKFYLLLFSLFAFNILFSQCPVINSAMVNSCGAGEGPNEFIVFTTTASAAVSAYTLYYGSSSTPSSSPTGTMYGSDASVKTGTGNITSTTGCTINQVTSASTVIPANSIVMFIPANFTEQYDASSLCGSGNIYVVYINVLSGSSDWANDIASPSGTLANNPSGARYIQITNGANTCTANIRTYTSGWGNANADGNALSWDNAGTPTYVNNGCSIIPPPAGVTITPATPVAVCRNAATVTINYTVTGSPDKYSLDWNAAANAAGFIDVVNATLTPSSISIALPSGAVAGTTYTGSLVATNTGTGVNSVAQNISINILDKPVVANIIGVTSLCEGYTYFSLSNATPGGVWSSNNTAIATVTSIGSLTGVAPGNTSIIYTVTNSCGSTASLPFNVTITSLPVVPAISGTSNICTGSTATFTNAAPGGTWGTSNAAVANINSSGLVTGIAAGTATITYTVSNSCGPVSQTFIVTVGNQPAVAEITGATTVCVGATIALSNMTTGGVWGSNNSAIANVSSTGIVTGVAAGTTAITYTVTSGCGTTTKTFTLTVNDKPAVPANITGASTVCTGTTINLTNATAGGVWSSNNTAVATVNNSGVVTGMATGNASIIYTVTNSCGSTASLPFSITITGLPVVANIAGASNICIGSTSILTNATAGGVWSTSNAAIANVNNAGIVAGVAAGTAIITYTVTNSCGAASKTFVVTVGNQPIVAEITGVANICAGISTTLNNATTGGIWNSNNAAIASINNSGIVTGIAQGTATITYTVTSACGLTIKSFIITINDKPAIPANITGASALCSGNTTTLTNATTGGVWSSNNIGVATVNNSGVVTAVVQGQAIITYSVSNTCGVAASNPFVVTVNSVPVVSNITGPSVVNTGSTITVANTTLGGVWSSSNPAIAGVSTTGVVTGIAVGKDTIIYTVTNSCGATIKTFPITVTVPDREDIFIPNTFTPNNDGRNDAFKIYGFSIASLEMKIFNQWGEVIFKTNDVDGKWDGSYGSRQQAVGVYVYVAKIKLQNGKLINKKGSINLIR